MKHRKIIGIAAPIALIVLFCAPLAWAESISIAGYRQELQGIVAKVDSLESHPENAGALVASIPDQVSVTTNSGEIKVSYKALKDSLAAFAAADEKTRPGLLREIREYARVMSEASEGYENNAADTATAHHKLEEILSRREFKQQGQSAKDALLARIYYWIARWLSKIVFKGQTSFDLMRLIIYLLVGAAATLLLVWTIRRLRRPQEELAQREIIPFAPSARSWRAWLADARAQAQKEDWRNAIHLAYWAGISYLEEHGAWKPNRARTPREYLRLIGKTAAQYPVLAALTRKLEIVWYGYGTAAETDFHEALGQLEKLGCR
ncbi:MAG TPA: DUF4129 domain-containing protein [Candidatus Angelobacter sp.]|nr:DUF4129 domain-containing protein [Candidatus Angelobacter sp.]